MKIVKRSLCHLLPTSSDGAEKNSTLAENAENAEAQRKSGGWEVSPRAIGFLNFISLPWLFLRASASPRSPREKGCRLFLRAFVRMDVACSFDCDSEFFRPERRPLGCVGTSDGIHSIPSFTRPLCSLLRNPKVVLSFPLLGSRWALRSCFGPRQVGGLFCQSSSLRRRR